MLEPKYPLWLTLSFNVGDRSLQIERYAIVAKPLYVVHCRSPAILFRMLGLV